MSNRSSTVESARPLLGLLAALTVLAGSSSLLVPLDGNIWITPLLQVVGVIWLAGVLCRLLAFPAPATILVQVLGASAAITALFSTRGWWGFIPNKAVLDQLGGLISEAWNQILVTAPPAPATPELSFLIVLTVGMTALITDFLVVEARASALVALPLLCLYSVPASIVEEMLPWWAFALPAGMYVLLLVASGHRGKATTSSARLGVAVTAVVAATLAISVSLVAADSVESVGTAGRIPRTNGGSGDVGLSPFTSLHGDLRRKDPVKYLTISGDTAGDYLRTVGLETWTNGEGWSLGELRDDLGVTDDAVTLPPLSIAGSGLETVAITIQNYKDKFLPVFAGTQTVTGIDGNWFLDATTRALHRTDPIKPGDYQLETSFGQPSAEELAGDTVSGANSSLLAVGDLPNGVRDDALAVTAGASTPYEKADRLEKYFTDPANGFVYSLTVPTGNSGDALVDFLNLKQGYCEQYASAMAVMLRAVGVPARVAIGFTGGIETEDGDLQITSHQAHAWVEVKFDTAGWVRFDPTPLGEGGNADPTDSETTSETTAEPTEKTTDTPESSVVTTTTTTTTVTPTVTVGGTTTGGQVAVGGAPEAPSRVLAVTGWSLLVLVGIGLIVAAVAAPSFLRRRRTGRRMAVAGSGPAGAPAAWAEVEDLALDHGIVFEEHLSARSAANRLARVGQLADHAREGLRRITLATEQAWYAAPAVGSAGGAGSGGAGGAGSGVGRAGAATGGPGGTGVPGPGAEAPIPLVDTTVDDADAPRTYADDIALIKRELDQTMPLTRWDRLFPRSMRPSARRRGAAKNPADGEAGRD